ncbi:MAG TPA: hypothetical protein VHU84_10175, partial [Lacipirellulaceae bacterium]|nr:hypothetical protein [Lacipirellulaceae bacterium]
MRNLIPFTLALMLVGSSTLGAPVFNLTDLGVLPGGTSSHATAINDNGTVVGYSEVTGGANHAFIWTSGGGMQDLIPTSGSSQAFDINNNDNVVGTSDDQAFRWTNSTGVVLIDSQETGRANAVNANDEVIGLRSLGTQNRTIEWSALNAITNPYPTTNTQGIANNNLGQYVGLQPSGFYSVGGISARQSLPAGFIPTDINDARQIPGSLLGIATLYDFDNSTTTTIGKLSPTDSSSNALGINQTGTIAGVSQGTGGFLYDQSQGGPLNLTSLLAPQYAGWTITTAEDINNVNQIVGVGEFNGVSHAILLTPVPEPSALLLALMGCSALAVVCPRCGSERNWFGKSWVSLWCDHRSYWQLTQFWKFFIGFITFFVIALIWHLSLLDSSSHWARSKHDLTFLVCHPFCFAPAMGLLFSVLDRELLMSLRFWYAVLLLFILVVAGLCIAQINAPHVSMDHPIAAPFETVVFMGAVGIFIWYFLAATWFHRVTQVVFVRLSAAASLMLLWIPLRVYADISVPLAQPHVTYMNAIGAIFFPIWPFVGGAGPVQPPAKFALIVAIIVGVCFVIHA